MVRHALFCSLVLAVLAGCARSEDASVVADANELQPVERVRTPERDEGEVAIGEWRDTLQEDRAALEFGPAGAAPLFSLRCDARRGLLLQRHGALPAGDLPMMLVSIGSETRRLAVTTVGGTVPMLRASLPPSDGLTDTLADAAEPIHVRVGDAPPLVLPPGPSVGAFIERCGSGAAAPPAETEEAPAEPAADNAAEAEAE